MSMWPGLKKPGGGPSSAAGLHAVMAGEGIEMPVVSLRIDYRKALKHGDEVVLESYCEARRGVRWPWTTRFLSASW